MLNHTYKQTATGEALRARPNFVTYVRTLQFFAQRFREAEKRQAVHIATKEIEERFFVWPELDRKTELQRLQDAGEIAIHKNTTPTGRTLYKYEALKPGKIAPAMIKSRGLQLDEVTRPMLEHLQAVSLPQGAPSTLYFDAFLSLKSKFARLFFTVDAFAGRVHTPITNFHRTHRPNILLHGARTTSLDVATMQPLILGKVLKANIGANDFSSWITSGQDVYLMLQDAAKLKNRDEAKKRFFEIMFAPANDSLAQMFGAANWINWINEYKRQRLDLNPHSIEKSHSNMAWLLQATEVKVMRQVWAKLNAAGVPFLSVHDEIITRVQDAATAEGIFRSVLDAEFEYYKLNNKADVERLQELRNFFNAVELPYSVHLHGETYAKPASGFIKACFAIIENNEPEKDAAFEGLEFIKTKLISHE